MLEYIFLFHIMLIHLRLTWLSVKLLVDCEIKGPVTDQLPGIFRQSYISRLNTISVALIFQSLQIYLHWNNWVDHVHYKSTFVSIKIN